MPLTKSFRKLVLLVVFSISIAVGVALLIVEMRAPIPAWESSLLSIAYVLIVAHLAQRIRPSAPQSSTSSGGAIHRKWPDLAKAVLFFLMSMLWTAIVAAIAKESVVAAVVIIIPSVTLLVIAGFYFGRSIYNRVRLR